jgi:hypothetical protein
LGQSGSTGVRGISRTWHGVYGESDSTSGGVGVWGYGKNGTGVVGIGKSWHGVIGESDSTSGGVGVYGIGHKGSGVIGVGKTWIGVYGESESVNGGAGVWGNGKGVCNGVYGESANGIGIIGKGGRLAGLFQGNVEVTGDIRLLNADCAEEFDIAEAEVVEPGTVMVLGEEGALRLSQKAYDKCVAGIVSGAGDYQPALVLDRQATGGRRLPIALMGKVFCKVDASYGEIEIGDLLTTSPTPGYAMKADDPMKAFGSVIGKALRALGGGQGLIPVLVALQ